MRVRDLAVETWSALDANRGRSALTILGIVIGIGAVIAMTALIGGINRALIGELGLSQARLVNINIYDGVHSLKMDDCEKMQASLTDYEYVTGSSWGSADITSATKKASGQLQGVSDVYFKAMGTKFIDGRAFTKAEIDSNAMVLIIDQNAIRVLFGSADAKAVGQTVRVGNNECTIIGVTEPSGYSFGGEDSVNGYFPITTMAQRITGMDDLSQVYGFAREGADIEALVEKTKDYLALTYQIPEKERENSIYVYSTQSMIDSVNATMSSFSLLMTVVAGISLLVGGIGIMNMMLTNVTERIREIGLRKALGAKRIDITSQFILESICLCLMGGLVGVILGYLGAFALAGLASGAFEAVGGGMTSSVVPYIDGGTVLMATTICVGTGLLFGWYPARRAARLDPVESLHYQ